MAVAFWRRLAAQAVVPIYPLVGQGGRGAVRRLSMDPRVAIVASPRHATVLVVAGIVPQPLQEEARQVHDQLPGPRAVLACGDDRTFPDAQRVPIAADPVPAILQLHRDLMTQQQPSAAPLGPGDNPRAWRGVGPYGQGGKGMMGGIPYGRAMAMTGPDVRDGLNLDRLPFTLGPFLHWLAPGLRLTLELQGDVIQSVVPRLPGWSDPDLPEPFLAARHGPVRIADLERARARHHLEATADLLFVVGLSALARKVLRLASGRLERPAEIGALLKTLRRTSGLGLVTRRIGAVPSALLEGMGPVARAAGLAQDARSHDPAYRSLGFEVIVMQAGDANARWQQRLLEAGQALELAQRAGDRWREPGADVEGPRGPLEGGRPVVALLPKVAVGMPYDAFVTTLVSLDPAPSSYPKGGR